MDFEGARLFLLVRGDHARAPVLLWLHGGPGSSERPLFRYFNQELERDFVVAYWDQRGAGRSFHPKADPVRLTVAQHLADLDAVIDHLRNTLHCDKVTLAGHSWGGTVGLLYSQAHPEMVRALFAVNPLIATADGERAKFAFVLASAEARKDARVLEQIKKLNERRPLIDLDQPLQLDRLVDRYGGLFHRRPEKVWVALHALALGLTTPTDLLNIIRGNNISLQAMQKELLPLDLRRTVPRLETPVVFLVGRFDHQTDSGITANYFDSLACTDKRLFWFENSAHNVPFEEPERFDDTIVQGFESITKGTAGAN